jgi:hypothetical protein
MSVLGLFRELRHKAEILADNGGYDLAEAEMNPAIYARFAEFLADEEGRTVFEPFANPDGRTFSVFRNAGIKVTAYSLTAEHPDILIADATEEEPDGDFDGVLFHPPYFGSKPLSMDRRDLSRYDDEDEWLTQMESAVDVAVEHLNPEGVVCAVGRRYRHNGKEIKLDEWLVQAFYGALVPVEVWLSEPDVAIILRFEE